MDKDLLYRFFERRASIEEMKEIKQWSELSDANRDLLYKERKLFDAMQVLASPTPDKKKTTSPRRSIHKSFVREFMKIAAVITVTVCITATFLSIGNNYTDSAMQTVTVPSGQRANVILPDGTDVWLNAGTTIRYPISFMKGKREIILDGEAYFEVVHNEKCPFVVHTYAMDVEVLGTKFNVEAYSKKDFFETSLMQGKVKVASPSNETQSVILAPNQKTTLENGKLTVSNIDDYNMYRWKEGLYCFRDKPLADIMKDLEKYFDLSISIHNREIEKVMLTGKFRIAEGLDYILRVLQTNVDFTYKRNVEENKIDIN